MSTYFFDKALTTVYIGSDHAGFNHKQEIIVYLKQKKIKVEDMGTHSIESCDYPDVVAPVGRSVHDNKTALGVLICGSANGVAISANKFPNVRAAICWNEEITMLARKHNDANIICLPSRFLNVSICIQFVAIFLSTFFEGGRHQKRVDKISSLFS